MAANTEEEDGVVEDFALEDEVFKELEPHKDPDVLVCCETCTATLSRPQACPRRPLTPQACICPCRPSWKGGCSQSM